MTYRILLILAVLILTTLGIAPENSYAQTQCPLADRVEYPFDVNAVQLAQAFAAPSPRHFGRYHTGEDWVFREVDSLGQPVKAIAAGRVTYSFVNGWGRDGGVVIIEHTFADGAVVYSQYGHLTETEQYKFPMRLGCVEAGEIIGAVTSARPAPHVHFEVKLSGADVPGPGYSWANPYDEGWRHPSRFVLNRQAWAHAAHRWHLQTTDPTGFQAPPLQLDDHSLLYLDGLTLRSATYDGRVLWRVLLNKPALAVVAFRQQPLVIYADGTLQQVDYQGQMVESWTLPDVRLTGAPLVVNDALWFRTTDGALVAISANRRAIDWRLADVPAFVRAHVTPDQVALLTADHRLLRLSHQGALLGETQLRAAASFATAPDGALLVYASGGLWRVPADSGEWTLAHPDARAQTHSNAISALGDGRITTFDGETLTAFSADGAALWALPLNVSGMAQLLPIESLLLLVSTHGQIAVVNPATGRLCGVVRVYGSDHAQTWAALGVDQVLRVLVGDQVIGLEWRMLSQSCPSA